MSIPGSNPSTYVPVQQTDSIRYSIPRNLIPTQHRYEPGIIPSKPSERQALTLTSPESSHTEGVTVRHDETERGNCPSSDIPVLVEADQRPLKTNSVHSEEEDVLIGRTQRADTHEIKLNWVPYTLKWPYLLTLVLLSLLLSAIVGFLTWYSVVHDGLGYETSSTTLLFGWRFSPTLVAVLYVLLQTMLLVDVRRTEVHARLARNSASSTKESILHVFDFWWNDPREALRKQKDGGWRSWTLFWASIANIIGTLVVSPLSAGLLSIETIPITSPAQFERIDAFGKIPLVATADDTTYVRSIASSSIGLTTSAWLSDQYAVLPFWPSSLQKVPLGSVLTSSAQSWTGNTTVFQVVMDCKPMWLSKVGYQPAKTLYPPPYIPELPVFVSPYVSLQLTSADGCIYEFASAQDNGIGLFESGGGWWSNTSSHSYPEIADLGIPDIVIANSTACNYRDVFFVTTPFQNISTRAAGHVCSSTYYGGDVETTVTSSTSQTSVSFDKKLYERLRHPIGSLFDEASFEELFHGPEWATKFQPPRTDFLHPMIGGPLLPIASLYNFNIESLMNNVSIVEQAKSTKQRFFGEALQNKFASIGARNSIAFSGKITILESRVAVNFAVGISLSVLLLLSAVMFTLVSWHSRPQRRPLGLSKDPASAAASTAFIAGHESRFEFGGADRASKEELHELLDSKSCRLRTEELLVMNAPVMSSNQKKRAKQKKSLDWRPYVLHGWSGASALVFMVALITAISVLYVKSKASALYQTFFVYQTVYSIGKGITANIAPYSIIPTLLAIIVKLWWASLESIFKRLQPYVQMSRQPTRAAQGITLSYIDSVLLWASWRAAKNGHWLLGLVTTGAFLTEVLTISMSALWSREPGVLALNQSIPRQLELRSVPSIFVATIRDETTGGHEGDTVQRSILIQLYGSVLNSWLYTGFVDLVYNGSRPAWTTDDQWSFAPVDTTNLSIPAIQKVGSNSSTLTTSQSGLGANITLDTPGMRARIECTEIDLSNTSAWAETLDFTNHTSWNVSSLIPDLDIGYSLSAYFPINLGPYQEVWVGNITNFFADDHLITCCANMTEDVPGQAAIGYWSLNNNYFGSTQTNFTVKWIVGNPYKQMVSPEVNQMFDPGGYHQDSYFVWSKIPRMTALNCMPIFETANAVVTVDIASESVQQFNLTTTPLSDNNAWSDFWLVHGNQSMAKEEANKNGTYIPPVLNVTVSHGFLFLASLLSAADTTWLGHRFEGEGGAQPEDLTDKTFNFRTKGLNTDFMSFASLALQNNDVESLLDPEILYSTSNKVFSTFFQHFVSNNVSMKYGSYGFQPVNASLPWDLPPILNEDTNELTAYQDHNATHHLSSSVDTTIHVDIQQLHMSPIAVYLSMSILGILLIITIWIYTRHRQYFKALPRDVDSIASILGFVYDSPKLIRWVEENKHKKNWGLGKGEGNEVMASMGWFDGDHWGIELLDEGEGRGSDMKAKVERDSRSSTVSDEAEALASSGRSD